MSGWIGVDLDGTLAEWGEGTSNPCDVLKIGDPVPAMLLRVIDLLQHGHDVRIFTARVGPATAEECPVYGIGTHAEWCAYQEGLIVAWCMKHLRMQLPITATKDFHMIQLFDDRCVQVIPNTGEAVQDLFWRKCEELKELEGMLDRLGS